jgi:hypothetical protein
MKHAARAGISSSSREEIMSTADTAYIALVLVTFAIFGAALAGGTWWSRHPN